MSKLDLIKDLEKYHHAFLSPEGAKHFLEPFGLQPRTRIAKDTSSEFKGLTLQDDDGNPMDEAEGMDALTVSAMIANHFNLDVPGYHGRGSQHQAYCEAIEKHLQTNNIN